MKKITKVFAASVVLASLFVSCATTKTVDESAPEKTEKTAKAEKKAETEEKKTAKAEKSKKSEKPAKEKKSKAKKVKFDQDAYDKAYEAGDYATCIGMLNGKGNKTDLIRDELDADMLTYFSADYTGAGKAFLETYNKMQQVSSEMNAGDVINAAMTAEKNVTYSGAEYERYLAWSMRLASALSTNQIDVANGIMKDYIGTFMDEIQALRAKNQELENGSAAALEGDSFKQAVKVLESFSINLGIGDMLDLVPPKSNQKYEYSPFFSYLGTVAYAANNDFDHAKDFASTYKVNNNLVNEVINVPKGKGHLEVITLTGTIGKREDSNLKQVAVNVPNLPKPIYTKVSYPVFKGGNHKIDSVKVSLSDGTSKTINLNKEYIEDFDKAVKIDVAQKARPAAQRSIFRNVIKNSASIAGLIAANEGLKKASANPLTQKAAQIAFDKAYDPIVAAIIDLEKADTRQGEYFPNKASVAGFSVAPGAYSVTIEYMYGGTVVETKTIDNVVVNEGKVSVAVSSCEK